MLDTCIDRQIDGPITDEGLRHSGVGWVDDPVVDDVERPGSPEAGG